MSLMFTYYYETFLVRLKVSNYSNGCLEVTLFFYFQDGSFSTWTPITVGLELPLCDKDCAYIDLYLIGQEILDWLVQNKIATPTRRICNPDGCPYQIYRFDPEVLKSLDPVGYAEYIEHWERCNVGDEDE